MTAPYTWSTVRVFADYFRRSDGSAAAGYVCFSAPQIVRVDDSVVMPDPIEIPLDANGHVEVQLPTTDDPAISPADWAWEVRELIDNEERRYFIQVPTGSADINLATVAPVDTPVAMTWFISGASMIRVVPTLPDSPDPTVIYITTD